MTAVELLRRASERGLIVSVRGDDRLVVRGRVDAIEELRPALQEHKGEVIEELRSRTLVEAEAIAYRARLLRECRWIPEASPCNFHVGHADESCRRCGAPLLEHYNAGNGARQ